MTLLSKLHTGESNSEKENLESQNTIFLKVIKCRSHKTENYFIASISLLHNTIIMKKTKQSKNMKQDNSSAETSGQETMQKSIQLQHLNGYIATN